ncbi:MAG TPA: hypothetical protein VGZ50_03390 [Actinomycetota bacterium]|nr:hypothetical protein [Actinomycetota bacterium]
MRPTIRGIALVPLVAALLLAACGEAPSDEHVIDEPATVQEVEDGEVARVTITQKAAERLDIQTALVEAVGERTVVSSAAVLVDPAGDFWVFTNPEPLVFVRHKISIDYEEGNQAFLTDGPPAGSKIVTVGVAELYGAEYGVGH